MLSSTTTKPAKGLRLTQYDREQVRKNFAEPLSELNAKDRTKKHSVWAKQAYNHMYTPEEQRALKLLAKNAHVSGATSRYLRSVERNDAGTNWARSSYFDFGETTLLIGSGDILIPLAVMAEYDAIERAWEEREKEIANLVRELNSVLLTAKTRVELGALWPPAEKLMGSAWINAKAEPNTLPVVQTTNITAAVELITAPKAA